MHIGLKYIGSLTWKHLINQINNYQFIRQAGRCRCTLKWIPIDAKCWQRCNGNWSKDVRREREGKKGEIPLLKEKRST